MMIRARNDFTGIDAFDGLISFTLLLIFLAGCLNFVLEIAFREGSLSRFRSETDISAGRFRMRILLRVLFDLGEFVQ